MAAAIYLADVPTYAALIAVYPNGGANLAALSAGTRVYVEDMGSEVVRSPSGKFWTPVKHITAPKFGGSGATWVGPANLTSISNSGTLPARLNCRSMFFRMPGGRPATVDRISFWLQAAAAATDAAHDQFDLRVYQAYPNGAPIESAAPYCIWSFNVGGTGGATALTLTTGGGSRKHADIPGGAVEVPAYFWLGFVHNYDTTAPSMGVSTGSSFSFDFAPAELSGSDISTVASVTRSSGYSWTDAGWTQGAAVVWPAGASYVQPASSPFAAFHLRVTA